MEGRGVAAAGWLPCRLQLASSQLTASGVQLIPAARTDTRDTAARTAARSPRRGSDSYHADEAYQERERKGPCGLHPPAFGFAAEKNETSVWHISGL